MDLSIVDFQVAMHQGIARLFNQLYKPPGAWARAYFRSIYALAVLSNPDVVIDVGTERGVSTMALALALKVLGKPLTSLVTIDVDHALWKRLPGVHADLLEKHDMDLGEVRAITENFCDLWPQDFLPSPGRVFIFYDVHDYFEGMEGLLPSTRFVNGWLPHLDVATVLIDNMYLHCPPDGVLYHPSQAQHWLGQTYYGFNECAVFVGWLNEHQGQLFAIPEANQAYFLVREGKPL